MFCVPAISKGKGTVTKGGFDPDAAAFFAAAGITDSTQKSAVNQLVLDLKSESLWTPLHVIYPLVGGSDSSHSYNLKNPAAFQINWEGTVTHDANGITGDGSTGHGETGIIPNDFDPLDWSQGVYSRTNSDAVMVDFSCVDGLTKYSRLALNIGGQAFFDQPDDAGGSGQNRQTNSNSSGLIHGSRISATDSKIYRNGTSLGGIATNGTGASTTDLTLLAENGVGAHVFFSNRNLAFAFVATGLDTTESAALYTAVQAFQTALGRQV